MANLVKVYGPNGEVKTETLLNARDLVHAGWSFKAHEKTHPIEPLPAGIVPRKTIPAVGPTQEVWNRLDGATEEKPEPVDVVVEDPIVDLYPPAEEPVVQAEKSTSKPFERKRR